MVGETEMEGLLDKIVRRVHTNLKKRKVQIKKPVQTIPVSQAKKQVPPTMITLEKKMTTENIVVENVPEEVLQEDYLLKQIDEFRVKAQQLQNLMIKKETKVQELQEIVDEREVKARELEYILDERQRKADGITEEVTKQIDCLIDKVSQKMDAISVTLGSDIQTFGNLNKEQLEEMKNTLGSLSEQQAEELRNALSELNNQLSLVKDELSEKVHSENVRCYRNIADLLKSVEDKLDKANEIEKKVISVHKCTIAIIVFSVLNMLGLIGLALYELGIFKLLLG